MIQLEDKLYTSTEVANILGVSLRSVYRYLEENKMTTEADGKNLVEGEAVPVAEAKSEDKIIADDPVAAKLRELGVDVALEIHLSAPRSCGLGTASAPASASSWPGPACAGRSRPLAFAAFPRKFLLLYCF